VVTQVYRTEKTTIIGQRKLFKLRVKYTYEFKTSDMKGYFNEKSLEAYNLLIADKAGVDFSEEEIYDFTRCVRPDGSAYGTGYKCRKGVEQAKEDKIIGNPNKEKIEKARTTYTDALNRELASYNTNDKAAIAKAKAESKEAFQAYKKEYDKGKAKSPADLVTPQKQGKADVDRMKKYLKDEEDKLKNLNDSIQKNSSRANDPDVLSRRRVLERNVAAVKNQLRDL